MASPDVVEIESLVAPISDESPAGSDLRADPNPNSLYYQIKDARSAARATERQWEQAFDDDDRASLSPPDWKPVIKLTPTAITENSKNLEIVAYYIEALCREYGFAGLRDGFRLTLELCEKFWDDIYPLPDEDGMLTRVAPLAGLNGEDSEGTLIRPIFAIPLTDGSDGGLSQSDYEQASDLETVADPAVKARRIDEGAISVAMFDQSSTETTTTFFKNMLEDMDSCLATFKQLSDMLDEKCGDASPPTSMIRAAIEKCRHTVTSVAGSKLDPEEEYVEEGEVEAGEDGGGAAAGGGGVRVPAGAIANRADALRTLSKVAEFFRKTEPHTPLSYALDQAVRWGGMALPELLRELIPEDDARTNLFKLVGIRPEEDGV